MSKTNGKEKSYIVIWHEENDSGGLRDNMGVTRDFGSWKDAETWIRRTIAEDDERSRDGGFGPIEVTGPCSMGHWKTVGNNQVCHYEIKQVETGPAPAGENGEWAAYGVDVTFSPTVHLFPIYAKSARHAEEIVWKLVDDGKLVLMEEQKKQVIADILENVERVKAVDLEENGKKGGDYAK